MEEGTETTKTTTAPVESKKEHWLITMIFFIPRAIARLFSAFDMADGGLSLKKILAAYSTYEAAKVTNKLLEPNNVVIFCIIWLAYAGILVGIYSLKDISKAVSSIKGSASVQTDAPPQQ